MYWSIAYLIAAILVSTTAVAEERSFVFLEQHRDNPSNLIAVCSGPGDRMSQHKELIQVAKKLGIPTGSCAGAIDEMAIVFFTVGGGPLYLTPTQIELVVKAAEARGIVQPYQVSDT